MIRLTLKIGLGLALIRWQGVYKDVEAHWLRCATLDGVLLPTAQEAAEQKANQAEQEAVQAKQEAVQAKQEAVQAKQRAAQLAEKLRALGVNPDDI